MPYRDDVRLWPEKIRQRYENYLKTSFFFKDAGLRASFENALQQHQQLLSGPYSEVARQFGCTVSARELAKEFFSVGSSELCPALLDNPLYLHQEQAIRTVHGESRNAVVASGTASGKTECFLYPILFELFRQHRTGELKTPGVRAMILYPMNALANDQRERLGEICRDLHEAGSDFRFQFGQYTGQTPEDKKDKWRFASKRWDKQLPGELVFRRQMREKPPHILLTNYSMLEYLLLRPDDSPLFDRGRSTHWQFIVLDEVHQYRGAKGMEMAMLLRRLKQRLRDGGRKRPFRCIATSATISSGSAQEDREVVAEFAQELFGEPFAAKGISMESSRTGSSGKSPRRYHAFLRALEGAFLVHEHGVDAVSLNRTSAGENGSNVKALEIALCRECGQHYYVGRHQNGKLMEAIRDPSQRNFGVDFYMPDENGKELLCRKCGSLARSSLQCGCRAEVRVKKCKLRKDHADQLEKCGACGYRRGGIGDPVQEIIHGSDGPNSVIATALHELLPKDRRKVLAFADSRQEAAFFAWYVQESYEKLRDRNLMLRAIRAEPLAETGLSISDLTNRLLKQWDQVGLFGSSDTRENRNRRVLTSLLREAMTEERRLSLSGVGLVKWFVEIPEDLNLPSTLGDAPWRFTDDEVRQFLGYLLDEMCQRRAMHLPEDSWAPVWDNISPWPQKAYCLGPPYGRRNVLQWGSPRSALLSHFLHRIGQNSEQSGSDRNSSAETLMLEIAHALLEYPRDPILTLGKPDSTFRLNPGWLRVKLASPEELWECDTCAKLSAFNVRNVCPRNQCPGSLSRVDIGRLQKNHYRILYERADFPGELVAREHTAQIANEKARQRQEDFRKGEIQLLSSSTTFEVGVDLGDLDVVFLRNVPPEAFNYAQRVGRAGRRGNTGLALTYCRRNPHDLYHYQDPENRVVKGRVRPPRLKLSNKKIICRHMAATALSTFFRQDAHRFKTVETLVDSWSSPRAVSDFKNACEGNKQLKRSLLQIVPAAMHDQVGLGDDSWVNEIAGADSRFARVEDEVCSDFLEMQKNRELFAREQEYRKAHRAKRRLKTIACESTLNFLSRKAVIPKYGFPVDVVELETRSQDSDSAGVSLQRDLSQAIAEFAPGGRVVANKKEWRSCGLKTVTGRAWPVRHYKYDDARNFEQWNEGTRPGEWKGPKYLIPEFGFVTPLFERPKEPRGRAQRLYTTRPFFRGFGDEGSPEIRSVHDVQVSRASTGALVLLCEGKNREGFIICRSCGAHMTRKIYPHKSPSGSECRGKLDGFSLGHELVTDVLRLQFPGLCKEWVAYSVAYAVLLGASEELDVPHTDLNVTIAGGNNPGEAAIIIYDNVPGGAGLVVQMEQASVFAQVLKNARARVEGKCDCDTSCYGCLRSYQNQFAHHKLDRKLALQVLTRHAGAG